MDEYISRAGIIAEYDRQHQGPPGGARKIMETFPAADVRPVKRGHWVKRMEEKETPYYKALTPIWSCSECGLDYDPALAPRIHFCYNCGADFRDKKE